MRSSLFLIILLAGCADGLRWPINALTDPAEAAIYQERRGAVELVVKTEFDSIIADIQAGGGAALTRAFDAASVPDDDRATRAFQLNRDMGLYAGNPGALVTSLMVFGSS